MKKQLLMNFSNLIYESVNSIIFLKRGYSWILLEGGVANEV
jgi:hypothetical protein